MARVIYTAIASLDGYVEDADGGIPAAPDEEVNSFINHLQRPIGTYLYGRRLYEAMLYWEANSVDDQPAFVRDFTQIWRSAEKIVFSRILTDPQARAPASSGISNPRPCGP